MLGGMGKAAQYIGAHAAVGAVGGAIWESFPGEGSFFGGMARGAMYGVGIGAAHFGIGGAAIRSNSAKSMASKIGGMAGAGAMAGGAIGGIYGLFSGDTTMYGGGVKGMIAGAGLGAMGGAGARYGGAALRSNAGFKGGVRAAGRRAMGDIGRLGGPTIQSNSAFQSINSSLKNWR